MISLSATRYFQKYPLLPLAKLRHVCHGVAPVFSTLKTSAHSLDHYTEDNVMQEFLKERDVSGDFIAKLSDEIWLKKGLIRSSINREEPGGISGYDKSYNSRFLEEPEEEDNQGGFLKLKKTSEWLLGDSSSVPSNRRMVSKEVQNDGERRRRLNFLRYEALKKELLLLTVGIGTACTGYCLVAFSIQAAVSYAVGVFFSCIYLQLLCKHADSISRETVPQIFTKKKVKRIGVRSEDLQDQFERLVNGVGIALSSPRLVIPAAIYALWELSQRFALDVLDFQLVPAMVGVFAYKAAALFQVYRDNEDLQFIFPDNLDDPSG